MTTSPTISRTLVQFGAGNIGRSFIGQLFARAGWQVVFVDVNEDLLRALNERREYRVIVKHGDRPDETMPVRNVRGIDGRDISTVAEALAECDLAGVSVGQRALPHILPALAAGLTLRVERHGEKPLDLIIAENMHGAAAWFREQLTPLLPSDFPLARRLGLVETSIGKMAPIMRAEDLAGDPLVLFAEPYNKLLLDARGFLNPPPREVPGVTLVEPMAAYVERKLFVHNLGHAAVAYLGFLGAPELELISEAIEVNGVRERARKAMAQAAVALHWRYPGALTIVALEEHIEDLLDRFSNRALGDTVYRVGRDLPRKLAREDRLVGAMLLCARANLPFDAIAEVYRAALAFRATDEQGRMFDVDERFVAESLSRGAPYVLEYISGLRAEEPVDRVVRAELLRTIRETACEPA